MKNLGKIFLIALLIPNAIYASVVASVDYKSISVGETVTYSIKVSGSNLERPILNTICDSRVLATSSQTSIEMINGNYKKTKLLSYRFMPQKSCEISPINVKVDGKIEKTDTLSVEVKPATQDLNADFLIELQADKTDLFVGQPFTMTMQIKQKHTSRVIDSKYIAPKMNGLWHSKEPKQEKYDDGSFTVTKLIYKLTPQREGELKITPAQLAIATRNASRDMWGSFMQDVKWKSYFSNEIVINVKPIPLGAKFIGDFSINVSVDKHEINPNEPVNVSVEIKGEGNLEDITKFKPYIKGVSVFDEKPVIKGNTFREKLALVGDTDFEVPSFSLEFYNPRTKKLEKITSDEIAIKVNGTAVPTELKVKRDESTIPKIVKTEKIVTQKELSLLQVILVLLVGFMLGVLLMFFKPWSVLKREKSFDIKDEKKLIIKLMPYDNDKRVKEMLSDLEHNIYAKDKKQVDKKLLKELIKLYEIH